MQSTGFNKKIVIAGGAVVLGIVALLIALSIPRVGKVRVNVETLPNDSTVTVDGVKVKGNGSIYVTPGKHTLKASRQYFTTVTVKFDTEDPNLDDPIYLMPGAESDEAIAYLVQNPELAAAREAMGGDKANREQTEFSDKYPVTDKLPYQTYDYKIGYLVNDDGTVTYDIELYPVAVTPGTELYRQQLEDFLGQALNWLRGQGVDTTKAKINVSPDPAVVQVTQ